MFPENRTIYEIMLKNMVGTDRPHVTIMHGTEKRAIYISDNQGKNTVTHS
jgi:hypothetical protein